MKTGTIKICDHCKRSLPADKYHFYHNKNKKDRFCTRCIECYGYDFKPIPSDANNKICIVCGKEYPNDEEWFYRRTDTGKLRNECRTCTLIQKRQYYDEHKDEKLAYNRKRSKILSKTDVEFMLASRIRQRTGFILKGYNKSARTLELLGCDITTLKKHLEDQFTEGMSWANYGLGDDKWHMDHDPPLASYNLRDPAQQKEAFHYSRLHPVWQKKNISKNSIYNGMRYFYHKPPKPISKNSLSL